MAAAQEKGKRAMITMKDLRASYSGKEALHGISAEFPEGSISVIIGPNGSGKSTAVRSLVRLVPEMTGTLMLDGTDLSGLSSAELSRRIAYLPQNRNVPDITVERLVLHGRFPYLSYPRRYRDEDREKAEQAMERLDLTGFRERKLESLSGGQRQKAYLAMALAQDTEVILMDEPATFLDIGSQFEMMDLARSLADGGRTVIMILHDFESVLRYADHTVLMKEGKVLKSGSPEEILRSDEIVEAFDVKPCFFEADDGLHCYVRERDKGRDQH